MAQTVCNGDATVITIPQAFADLAGNVTGSQLPGGAPTGSGAVVMASGATLSSPSLVTPALGTPISGTLTNCTFPVLNQNTSGSSASCTGNTATVTGLSVTSAKTLTAQNTLTLAGTDSTVMTFPTTSATVARTDAGNTFTGHQTIEGVTSTGATGTGNLAFSASPTFTGTVGAAAITATGTVQAATLTSTGAVNAGTSKFVVNSSGLCTTYNNVATTGNGLPACVGVVTTGTHTAAITATNLLAAPVAGGFYRISAYMKITVATSTPVAGPITLAYKDNDSVVQSVVMCLSNAAGAVATSTGSTTTTPVSGEWFIYAGSGTAITYAVAFSGTGTYELVLKCESF